MLKTRNIFIDTETFVANNYFEKENLKRLCEFGGLEVVNLFLTDVTIHEIKSNIKEDLLNARDEINQFKKSISNKNKILRNIEKYKKYIELPSLNIDVDFNDIHDELESFIKKGRVSIIPSELADLKSIIQKYFNKEKPFGTGKKKYEFPDAIVLSCIEQWCTVNDCKIFIVSNDKDMSNYVSADILPIKNLRTILDLINKQYDNDKRIKWITEFYSKSKEEITNKITKRFITELSEDLYFDFKISDIEVEDILLLDESIVQDNTETGETIFQVEFDIHFLASVSFDYTFESGLDIDVLGDRWSLKERRTRTVAFSTTQLAEVVIETNYKDILNGSLEEYSIFCSYCSVPDEDYVNGKIEDIDE